MSASAYSAKRGYSRASLTKWAAKRSTSTFVRVEVVPNEAVALPELIVEVGRARLIVRAGFDAALLREVVRALETE